MDSPTGLFSDDFESMIPALAGDASMTSEKLVALAEAETAGRMLSIATQAGFESVEQVLRCFDGRMDEAGGDEFRARLNSGIPDAVVAFGELLSKVQAHDAAVDHAEAAERGGFTDQNELLAACEKATTASESGQPDRALELRITATPTDIVEGDAGDGG